MALVLAVSMVGVAFVGGVAAEDATLAGDDDDVVADWNASDEYTIDYTLDADDTDFDTDGTEEVYFNVSDEDGVEHFSYSAEVDGTDADYEFELDQDELETVPGDADSDVTVEMMAWGEDDDGDITTGPDEFDVTLEFQDEYAVIYVEEADDVEDEERFLRADIFQAESSADVGIAGDNTTVNVYTEDDDLADAVDLATEPTSDGDRVGLMMGSTLDGSLVYVFDGSAGETITGDDVENEDVSYVVIEDDDHYVIELGDDYDGEDEVDVDVLANDRPAFGDLRDDLDFGVLQAIGGAFGLSIPFLAAALGVAISRRRTDTGAEA